MGNKVLRFSESSLEQCQDFLYAEGVELSYDHMGMHRHYIIDTSKDFREILESDFIVKSGGQLSVWSLEDGSPTLVHRLCSPDEPLDKALAISVISGEYSLV